MNRFTSNYRDYIAELKTKWLGRNVIYAGAGYRVVDVDYNGCLLINKKAEFTDATAVETFAVQAV